MKFRTEIGIERGLDMMGIDRPVAAVGSCFADNITARMRHCLWQAENPLGVLFNPLSIRQVVNMALLRHHIPDIFDKELDGSLFESDGIWHSWLFDSSASANTREKCRRNCAEKMDRLLELLEAGGRLIVTFGTAYCYYYRAPGSREIIDGIETIYNVEEPLVANCHKMPGNLFVRRIVDIDGIVGAWDCLISELQYQFPDIEIIFTVSPVRHIRDGLHENQISKATLLLAVERLCKEYSFCHYFPAYEILLDDLRDYRFYANDLVHPSQQAIEYIWEKFVEAYVPDSERTTLKEGESLARRLSHRPLIADDPRNVAFKEETARMLKDFILRHPNTLS